MENEEIKKEISIDDFAKVEIRIGKIISAEIMPEKDKIIIFKIDIGENEARTILSGIREYYPDPNVLVGRFVPVITNLAPRKIGGIESNGMILYAVGEGEEFSTIEPSRAVKIGTRVE